ncbi:MAG: hypothetical protein HY782_21895 [Chloroflexi bacterium]|nr:hypothetical protein [Chloroflexota bacterium]
MWKTVGLVALWLALALWTNAEPARAQGPSGKTCATCHAQPALATRLANGEALSLYVDTTAFARSVHGQRGLTCADCHTALADRAAYHPASARCQDCHTTAGHKPVTLGVVGKLPHADANAYRAANANLTACQACHANQSAANQDRLHANVAEKGRTPTCTTCHNPHTTEPTVAPYREISAKCVDCHRTLYDEKLSRVHGHAPLTGASDSASNATCVECHSVHSATARPKPVVVRAAGDKACATCHASLGARGGNSLAADVRQPDVTMLGGRVALQVTSAHSDDTARNEVQQTCQSCHAETNLAFDALRRGSQRPARPSAPQGLGATWQASVLGAIAVAALALYVTQDFIVAAWRKQGIRESQRDFQSRESHE